MKYTDYILSITAGVIVACFSSYFAYKQTRKMLDTISYRKYTNNHEQSNVVSLHERGAF
ncbi:MULTISPECIES: hypothetical protein [unclassified Staphylococcus]|uniref:hypothetical protein n=1 Tax=unclassified Staphylococcus TaxID=91994 RepID=UPI001AEC235B|nr:MULTISPECIES: hypothetical protein [unclassified Staphylococcus]